MFEALDMKALTSLLSQTNISRKSTGKTDICWLGFVTAAEWILVDQNGDRLCVIALRFETVQDWCPRRTEQKTLKETHGAKLPSHEPDEKMPPG